MKKLQCFLFFAAFALVLLIPRPVMAAASGSIYKMNCAYPGSVYEKADVTGEGWEDKIEFVYSGHKNGSRTESLIVNGTTLRTWDYQDLEGYGMGISIITLKNQNSYIEIKCYDSDKEVYSTVLYQVRDGSLQKLIDYTDLLDRQFIYQDSYVCPTATKVKGNTIILQADISTKSLSTFTVTDLRLRYSNGKFKWETSDLGIKIAASKEFTAYTAARKIQTYQSAGSKKKGIVIKKKEKFTPVKATIKKKKLYVKVKNSAGKTGWIECSTDSTPFIKNFNALY